MAKKYTRVAVYPESRHRLKAVAAEEGKPLADYMDELSKSLLYERKEARKKLAKSGFELKF